MFVDLTDDDLVELQITLGGKKVIKKALSKIKVCHDLFDSNLHSLCMYIVLIVGIYLCC